MLAVVYIRVSTEDQARHGYSLEAQEAACRKKARELGAAQVEVYRDEGVTGEILERPGLQAALTAVNAGAAWFVVYDPDRLSRRLAHQLLLMEVIEKAGCRLEFVTCEWQDTPEGRLFYSLRGAIAEYEKEKFKARSRFGKLAKARRGLLTHDPRVYGYRHSSGKLEVDQDQAAVYRRMVEMALSGMSPEAIAAQFNAEGVPAPQGDKWYRATVRRILKNRTYVGELYLNRYNAEGIKAARQRGQKATCRERPKEDWIAVPVPALIEPEKWAALQEKLSRAKKGRRGGRVHSYHLSGLVACGLCGRAMAGQSGHSKNRTYRYYACLNTWDRANGDRREPIPKCTNRLHRADILEEAVWAKVREWLNDPEALFRDAHQEAGGRIENEINLVQKRLKQLKRERERAFEAYRRGLVDVEMFERAVLDVGREKAVLEARLKELEEVRQAALLAERGVEALRELARQVAGRLDDLSWGEKEKLINLLVRRVVVREGEVLVEARVQAAAGVSRSGTAPRVAVPPSKPFEAAAAAQLPRR